MAIILAQKIIVVTELGNRGIVLLLIQVVGVSPMYIQQIRLDVLAIMNLDAPLMILELLVLWIA
jgi:hypothetical protein